jgi:hypothetical protein
LLQNDVTSALFVTAVACRSSVRQAITCCIPARRAIPTLVSYGKPGRGLTRDETAFVGRCSLRGSETLQIDHSASLGDSVTSATGIRFSESAVGPRNSNNRRRRGARPSAVAPPRPPHKRRVQAIQQQMDHRRHVQGERLRQDQAADDCDAKRTAQLRAGASSDGERYRRIAPPWRSSGSDGKRSRHASKIARSVGRPR